MRMKQMFVVCAMLLAHTIPTYNAQAQGQDQVIRYIERYRSLAMSEQQRTGIPAAIKLAQAIHETGAGTSELAVQANNHFGLKCKSDWKGQTFEHNDDRRRECFRKYNIDFESYQDQSDYLKSNPRYRKLFKLSKTDYAAWAFGLREAGYATNPQYAQRLIQLVEEYHLQDYTYAAMGKTSLVSESIASTTTAPARDAYGRENGGYPPQQQQQPVQQDNARRSYDNNYNSGAARSNNTSWGGNRGSTPPVTTTIDNTPPARTSKYINTQPRERQTMVRGRQNGRDIEYPAQEPSTVVKINNLKAVYGKRGDMPLQYAVRNNIRYEKFLEINDLEQDQPLPADMPLYLERKHFWGIRPMHLVKPGETMLVIAQQEGIQLKYLRDLNYMEQDEEPMPGVTLELQAQAGEKPKTMKRSEALKKGVGSTAYANSPQPRSTFPKNPAPVYEEKNFFDKLKEKFEDSKIADKMPSNNQQSTYPQNNRQQYTQNRQQPQQQATAQNEPEDDGQSKYLQGMNGNEQQNAPAQTQQQPTQSYSRSQYSYSTRGNANANNNVTPNPAAQIYNGKDNEPEEEKLSRRERRKLEKEREEQAELAAQQAARQQQQLPQPPQQPKSELDKLKAQFDNVIYSENSGDNSRAQQTNPRYQAQQTQQQPQQNYGRQQYSNQNQQQQSYGNQQYGNHQQYNNNQQQAYNSQQQSSYGRQQQQYGNQQSNGYQQQNRQPQRDPSKFYTVQAGDTAYTIAKKHGITIRQLMDMNGLDFDEIRQGQELRIKL